MTPEVVREDGRLGVDRLALMPPQARQSGFPQAEFAEFIRANAPSVIGARPR
jgi:hypothetical protein